MSSENKISLPVTGLLGLVLAGGRSSRLGEDKAQLDFHGCPQTVFCRDLIRPFCERVYFSIRPDQTEDVVRSHESQILDSPQFEVPGPLTGILSAMQRYPDAAWLVVACDLPGLTPALICEMLAHRDMSCLATAFRDPVSGKPEPLCAIYESKAFSAALEYYRSGRICPRAFLSQSHVCLRDLPYPEALYNINTPQDKAAFLSDM